jgi:hypothetical protein
VLLELKPEEQAASVDGLFYSGPTRISAVGHRAVSLPRSKPVSDAIGDLILGRVELPPVLGICEESFTGSMGSDLLRD